MSGAHSLFFSTLIYFPLSVEVFAVLARNYSVVKFILAGFSQIFSLCSKNLENEHSYFSFVSKNECENERIFFCLSADVSAAHNFHDERERERHFLVSDSYSV